MQEPRADLRGTVRVERNGCLMLETTSGERRWIVWPAGQEDENGQPVLDGRVVPDGDALSGTGAELPGDALPAWTRQEGYFASLGEFCSVDATGIVVLDDVVRE